MIFKIVRKSMQKKLGLLIAIFVLVILSSMFVGIQYLTYDTLESSYEQMIDDGNPEDFRMYTIPSFSDEYDDEFLSDLETEYDLDLEYKDKTLYQYKEDDTTARNYSINPYIESDNYNNILLSAGDYPTGENEIVVLPTFLEHIGAEIGDSIEIDGNEFVISGTAYMMEYIIPMEIELFMLMPNYDNFAPIYMNEDTYNEMDFDDSAYSTSTYIVGSFNQDLKQVAQSELYEEITENELIEVPVVDETGMPQIDMSTGEMVMTEYPLIPFTLDVDFNSNVSGVEQEVNSSRSMFSFLSNVLTVLTIALAIVLVNSVFKAQRREMGILKAEGVSINKLSIGFGLYIAVIVIIGSIIGMALSYPLSSLMMSFYNDMFQIMAYPITFAIVYKVIINLAIVAIFIIVLVYLFSIRKNLEQPTLHLVKNINSDKAPKRNVTKIFSKLPFLHKYQLNIIFRNFSKTVLLFFGILVSSFLLLLGVLMYTTIDGMVNHTYFEVFDYEYLVNYNDGSDIKQSDSDNTFISTSVTIKDVITDSDDERTFDDNDKFTLETYDMDNTDFVHLKDNDGELINEEQGLVPTDGFLNIYDLEIGDEITIINPYDVDEEITLPIVNSTPDFFLSFVYADTDYIQEVLDIDDEYVNSEYSGNKLSDDEKDKIYEKDPNAFIFEMIDVQAQLADSMSIFITMILIVAGFASVIAFISLYSISSIIIDSNRKTISVMKVLGYSDKEVRRMTIGMYKWFVIVIYLLLLPLLESLIQTIVNVALSDAEFVLNITLNRTIALLGLVVIFIVYLISSNLTYRKIKNIKLSESLKADE